MSLRFIVSGTDTGIGKTVFLRRLLTHCKPITGSRCNPGSRKRPTARWWSGWVACRARILPEAYRLKMPASPHLSARFDNVTIEPELLLPPETDGPLVIEGAGGLLVPLTDTLLFVDIFARWRIPLILCARTSLGTINHTLLSLEALRLRAIPVHGVVFIGDENRENQRIIADIGRVRSLGRLPRIPEMTAEALHHAFAQQFDLADFLEVPA